jgi:hypothetical protein
MDKFVYYDPEYDPECTGKFISEDVSKAIVNFLRDRNFQRVKAKELREIMLSVVKNELKEPVIVFAPTALIRQFLDSGGSIVWVGDVPFYYQATQDGKRIDENWFLKGSPATMLGIRPTTALEIPKTNITKVGKRWGLRHSWTGIRPIVLDSRVIVLAEAKCSIAVAMYQLNRPSWHHALMNRMRRFTLGTAAFNIGIDLESIKSKPTEVMWRKKLANAWFVNFSGKA